MSNNTPNRRALLTGAAAYAAGAAIVTAGVAAVSEAKAAEPVTISSDLARLITQYEQADATLDRWYEATWNPAIEAHTAAIEAVPHIEVQAPSYRNVLDGKCAARTFSTADRLDVANCRGIVSIPLARQSADPKWRQVYRAARRLTAAVRWRRQQIARLDRQWGIAALSAREDELWKPIRAASSAIIAFPVASTLDLTAKLNHMYEIGTCEDDAEEYQKVVGADVRRLAGEARA